MRTKIQNKKKWLSAPPCFCGGRSKAREIWDILWCKEMVGFANSIFLIWEIKYTGVNL